MLDAWLPAVDAYRAEVASGGSMHNGLAAAADAARAGATATVDMESRRGRSKKLGKRSVGHVDPGAASAAIIIGAMSKSLADLLS